MASRSVLVYRVDTASKSYELTIRTQGGVKIATLVATKGTDAVEHRDNDPKIGSQSLFAVPPEAWIGQVLRVATMRTEPLVAVEKRETGSRSAAGPRPRMAAFYQIPIVEGLPAPRPTPAGPPRIRRAQKPPKLREGTLDELFRREAPLGWRRAFGILGELCRALVAPHERGVVHGNLTRETILLSGSSDQVELAPEAAIEAKFPQADRRRVFLNVNINVEYCSPEQLMGKLLDGRSDIYRLGVITYELMTGRLPFPDARGPAGLITAQLKTAPTPPSEVNAFSLIPARVDAVLLRCLDKDKVKRYPDLASLAEAVAEAIANEVPTGAEPVPLELSSRIIPIKARTGEAKERPKGVPAPARPKSSSSRPSRELDYPKKYVSRLEDAVYQLQSVSRATQLFDDVVGAERERLGQALTRCEELVEALRWRAKKARRKKK